MSMHLKHVIALNNFKFPNTANRIGYFPTWMRIFVEIAYASQTNIIIFNLII